jgi:hypothetical protein
MLRVSTKPRKRNSPRIAEKSAPGFLQWLRGRECACGGRNPGCGGKIQSAHGPDKATKGIGTKSTDACAMPLSLNCHALQHRIGWISFGITYLATRDFTTDTVKAICAEYWKKWPGRAAWERKLSDG